MDWFFIALIGPLLYASSNHIDKYLISKYLHNTGIGSLVIFSSLFSILVLPILAIFLDNVFAITFVSATLLALSGAIVVISLLCYFHALGKDEATFVVPFYQTIPVFGFILGYYLLNETLATHQIYGGLIIVFGASILSFDLDRERISFKKQVVILMLIASFIYALADIVFKFAGVEYGFWVSAFWALVGQTVIGILFFVFIKNYRDQFLTVIKNTGTKVLLLNSLNETLTIIADGTFRYAILIAPVTLVLLVNSAQPFFVFIIGLGLTIFAPQVSKENITKRILLQKLMGIVIIVIGSMFLR